MHTKIYMNSFFPDAITSWNIFITHFDDVPFFVTLKDYVNTFLSPNANSIFGIHDPKGLRYIFQLRVRSHKFRHNFDDTPDICSCNQGIEDTNHKYITKTQPELLRQSIAFVVIRSWITKFFRE